MILTWYIPNNGGSIEFSKTATDYRLLKSYQGFSSIPGEHSYCERAPGRHGKKRRETTLAPRDISFDIIVMATDLDDLQDKMQALTAAFNPLDGPGILELKKEDDTIYYLNCIGSQGNPVASPSQRSATHQLVTIKLVADEDPFWHMDAPTSPPDLDPNPANFFPFASGAGAWPFTLSSSTDHVTLTNTGSVSAPVIIVFTGPMVNPKLTNTYSIDGNDVTETLSATLTLDAAETLTINTDPNIMTAVYYVIGVDYNAHKYIDSTATFWQLQRGVNTLHLDPDSSSTGCSARITWSNRYIGV